MSEKDFLVQVKQHQRIIYKLVSLYAADAEEKKDLYQEVLLQAWKSFSSFRQEAKFSTWLYRVSFNTILTQKRKGSIIEYKDSIEDYSENMEGEAVSVPGFNSVKEMIRRLAETDRAIISMHLDGYEHAEIAAVTGISNNHVAVKGPSYQTTINKLFKNRKMNLEELWKDTGEGDDDLSSMIKPGLSKLPSKDPLVKLKRNLLAGAVLGLLIAALYIFIMVKFPVWQVFLCIGIVFAFTVWASIKSFFLYREMNITIAGNNLLKELESHYVKIKKWMSVQQEAGLLIYPVSATGGFMIGGSVGAGKSITELMQKPVIVIALLITLAILVPLCFYLAKWMSKKAFGKYAEQLKHNIDILKSEY